MSIIICDVFFNVSCSLFIIVYIIFVSVCCYFLLLLLYASTHILYEAGGNIASWRESGDLCRKTKKSKAPSSRDCFLIVKLLLRREKLIAEQHFSFLFPLLLRLRSLVDVEPLLFFLIVISIFKFEYNNVMIVGPSRNAERENQRN